MGIKAMTAVEKLEKLRKALRFYADRRHWERDTWNVKCIIIPEYGHPGKLARAVLAEIGEEGK